MAKRPLTSEEKTYTLKAVKRFKEGKVTQRLKTKIESIDIKLDSFAFQNFQKQIRDEKVNRNKLLLEIEKCQKLEEEDELAYLQSKLKHLNHLIEKELYVLYLDKIDDLKTKRKQFSDELKNTEFLISTLTDQLRNGVEVKPKIEIKQEEKEKNGKS